VRPRSNDVASTSALKRSRIVLVIADVPLTAPITERYRTRGYEVLAPTTPLDVIQRLLAVGDRVSVVVVSVEARWASGLDELISEEFPDIDHVLLA
jgi:hypothetical protein